MVERLGGLVGGGGGWCSRGFVSVWQGRGACHGLQKPGDTTEPGDEIE